MKILIAEDEYTIAMQYKKALEHRKHEVVVTLDGEECIKAYLDALTQAQLTNNTSPFDVVVLDERMPNKTGLEVAKEILKVNPDQRIIFASAYVKETLVDAVKQLNRASEVLQKPFRISAFVETVEDKETYKELEKFDVKVRTFKDLDRSNKEVCIMLDALSKIQKPDVWYAIGNITVGENGVKTIS